MKVKLEVRNSAMQDSVTLEAETLAKCAMLAFFSRVPLREPARVYVHGEDTVKVTIALSSYAEVVKGAFQDGN